MLTTIVQKNTYQDSVALMVLSRTLSDLDGVTKVSVMMGTPANKEILGATGFGSPEVDAAAATDLIIGIDADDPQSFREVVEQANALLAHQASAGASSGLARVHSLARARAKLPDANLAVVSIPGEYASAQAHELLESGLNVLLFSDNVSLEDEVMLKTRAGELGLLLMGPDCGTSAFAGVPLAFGNLCAAGSVGVVGASGTGTQEVMVQVDRLGAGISHAIGLGGRDLSEAVGGRTAVQALAALDADPRTEVIVLVSKPPAPSVRARVEQAAQQLSTPVVTVFLDGHDETGREGNLTQARTLSEAARRAVELAGTATFSRPDGGIVGLYTGGTLADEAAMILREELQLTADPGEPPAGTVLAAGPHRIVDLGDDVYTRGRPHPMIDPASRAEAIARALAEPSTAVLLLDLVLGHGSSADPAGAIAGPIREGLARAEAAGRQVRVVASICGTERDEQKLSAQAEVLREAGVRVLPDNAAAARHAAALARRIGTAAPSRSSDVPKAIAGLLGGPRTINVGLASFAEDLAGIGAPVVQWSWSPPAGGDAQLARLVDRLLMS
ncbi:FdrA protein [Propionibacterium cyclohexanicum]|uniref:FdrA protein n=1 Tax=Propionibacterium cyclohexanicum TaxID=64702 RepID=A0A1H9SHS8_9ACTN|nr:acyl-CoA synthetase FdrA [Propionibacterium cyclohexanicum]SER84537.1 FdrA protein [Propionibacterium cyclohexanicum]